MRATLRTARRTQLSTEQPVPSSSKIHLTNSWRTSIQRERVTDLLVSRCWIATLGVGLSRQKKGPDRCTISQSMGTDWLLTLAPMVDLGIYDSKVDTVELYGGDNLVLTGNSIRVLKATSDKILLQESDVKQSSLQGGEITVYECGGVALDARPTQKFEHINSRGSTRISLNPEAPLVDVPSVYLNYESRGKFLDGTTLHKIKSEETPDLTLELEPRGKALASFDTNATFVLQTCSVTHGGRGRAGALFLRDGAWLQAQDPLPAPLEADELSLGRLEGTHCRIKGGIFKVEAASISHAVLQDLQVSGGSWTLQSAKVETSVIQNVTFEGSEVTFSGSRIEGCTFDLEKYRIEGCTLIDVVLQGGLEGLTGCHLTNVTLPNGVVLTTLEEGSALGLPTRE